MDQSCSSTDLCSLRAGTKGDPTIDLLTIGDTDLQSLLAQGQITSLDIVHQRLHEIQIHDDNVYVMIVTTPIQHLEETASSLDRESLAGKDNINTPSLGLPTTVGSSVLLTSTV
ncbi:hypothetical protein VTJ49DRAFT_6943 [Mycothermus thermophilus]|uniref:Uncharacterized protein n=1 Tax=Humicola insolens TaxID=85995 RepID=A0ABR3VJL3_HUMIN